MNQRGSKTSDKPVDFIVDFMVKNKIPVTRENYLEIAYQDGLPEWSAELESMLPEELQKEM